MDKLKILVVKSVVRWLSNLSSFYYDSECEGCQNGKAHERAFIHSLFKCKV